MLGITAEGGDSFRGRDGHRRSRAPSTRRRFARWPSAARSRAPPRWAAGVRQRDQRRRGENQEIVSPVAGDADILLVPDLEAGNILAKELSYLAAAESAGIVLGAKVPIALTSRADSARTREASAAVMVLLARALRRRASPR